MTNQAAQTMPELPKKSGRATIKVSPGKYQTRDLYTADQMHQYARDYAAALSQPAVVAEGYAVVPIDPTGDMLDAILAPWLIGTKTQRECLTEGYRAMIVAAQSNDYASRCDTRDTYGAQPGSPEFDGADAFERYLRQTTQAAPAASGGVDYDEVWLLLKAAQTNIGACRPDWDADDAEHWDRLTAAMESVKAASIKQPGSINRPLVSDDSQNVAASVSERAREWEEWNDGDSSFLSVADSDARYEVSFAIHEGHSGVWRAYFNPDTEREPIKETHLGTFASKERAKKECEDHYNQANNYRDNDGGVPYVY